MTQDASKSRIDSILDAVDASIITIDTAGIVVNCNDATTRMFGYSRDELVNNNVKMLMPAPYRLEHDGYIKNHLDTGKNRIIGVGRQVSGRHRSGKQFPVHLSVAKYQDNGTYFTGILHDLTELEEARSASQRLGQIVDESVNEIYTFDVTSLKFTNVNRAAIKNLGYTLDELKRMTPVDIVFQLTEQLFDNTIQPLLAGKTERVSLTSKIVRKDQSQYEAEVTLHLSHAFGTPELAAIVQDVTEKNRMMESLRRNQKMESIGNLTGGIAHDFNNILTVIMGNLELMESELQDPDQVELLDEVKGAAEMGSRLTKRLLTFARRSPLSPNSTNVNRLISGLTEMISRTLGGNIALETNLVAEPWFTNVDISELENALVNLAINARDAMPAGGRLLIETENCVLDDETVPGTSIEQGNYVKISITDTGCGIPHELRDSLFEPFVTSKSGGNGTGLGLSMVYGFVHQSGGTISVYTEQDIGTSFSMYLPQEQKIYSDQSAVDNPADRQVTERKKFLIAEDNDQVRRLTTKRLIALGHDVVQAANGHDALALFKSDSTIDIVFTDVVMTEGMSGYDLAIAVRKISENTPVLLTSGFALNIISDEELLASGLPLLRKPYHQSELKAAIDELLKNT